jgi:AcrR family transcriptional regulator
MSSQISDTRTRILEAAWRLLEAGEGAGRMSDIAKAAGISRQAVYLHFATRAELLIATTLHIDAVKGVDDRLAASRAATGVDRLDAFIAAWGGYIPEIHAVSRALRAMQATDADARAAWDGRMEAVREGCEAAVAAVAAAGQLSPAISEAEAVDLIWALLAVEVWERLVLTCGWTQAQYLGRITTLARQAVISGC